MSLFRRKVARLAPPAVPTDKVMPVAYLDHHYRDAVLNVMLRFDQKLDASKLRRSLERLLDRQDAWRRMGARVRLDPNGKLHWHIPAKYTEKRPAVTYHHKRHNDISIRQHPLASRLRSRGGTTASSSTANDGGPWMVEPGSGIDFSPLMRQPSDPTCFEDYLYQDKPVIGLQITTFSDATLVSLGFSHIMWDAMGLKALLDAWSLTLQGRQSEVVPLIENDPLPLLGSSQEPTSTPKAATSTTPTRPPDKYKLGKKQLGVVQLVTLGLRQALDKILHRNPVEEFRTVCVPAAYIDSLRKDALQALQDNKTATPFLSDGDLICAWWTRNIIASRVRNAAKSNKTIAILNMMGLRGVLAQAGLLPERGVIVGNLVAPIPALLRARDLVAEGPLGLGRVARALRGAIATFGTRPQIEAFLALQRRAHGDQNSDDKKKGDAKPGLPALFGDGGMHMVVCTNWTKADFFKVDFSAAVVDEIGCDGLWNQERVSASSQPVDSAATSPAVTTNGPMGSDGLWEGEHVLRSKMPLPTASPATRVVAKPTGVHMHLITASTPAFLMSIFTILGRDGNGNYWIQGRLRKEYWAQIEEALGQRRAVTYNTVKFEPLTV